MSEKKVFGCWFWCTGALILFFFMIKYSYALEYLDLSPWNYQKLTDVDAQIVLFDTPMNGGKVLVTERVTFDVHQSSKNDLCYELWRDLPEQNIDGLDLDYNVISVKQIKKDGTAVEFNECSDYKWDNSDVDELEGLWYHSEGPYSKSMDQYECVFFYVDGIYRDTVTFEIQYEMNNVALKYKDCSDLYLLLYSESPIKDLKSYKAEILIPNEDMPSSGNYEVYTYGTNENQFYFRESSIANPGYYTFSIDLDEDELQFKPYNLYLEFELVAYGQDAHTLTDYAHTNHYSHDYALSEIRHEHSSYISSARSLEGNKTAAFLIALIGSGLVLWYAFSTKSRMHKKHMFFQPVTDIGVSNSIPSDLDPNFASALVFCKSKSLKDNTGIYTAILLSLSRKGYVEINDYGTDDAMITMKSPHLQQDATSIMPSEPLTECEQLYYDLLNRHSGGYPLAMSAFQSRISRDYEYTASFADNIDNAIVNIGINEHYIQKADFTEPKDSLLRASKKLWNTGLIFLILVNIVSFHTRLDLAYGGYFIFGFACIITSLYLKNVAPKYVLLTQLGETEYAKWRALYNYLNSDAILKDTSYVGVPIWERYYIYAAAFGISDKINNVLGIKCPDVMASPMLYNTYFRSGRVHVSSHRMRSSIRSSRSFVRASSTSRGYYGGGRGGYGGGGGH